MTTPVGALDRSGVVIVPQVIATALIDGVVRESAALSTFTRVPVGTKESIVPVLSKDIEASWVGGDTGLKSADTPKWDGEKLIAEDLAVLVPIPLNLLADQTFNITEAMRPLFTRAMARGIDRAALWGVDKP
jgi:HK97 family phage major capsid protein